MTVAGVSVGAAPPVTALLTLATDHHRNGRAAEAAILYRKVMEVAPGRTDVMLLLGIALSESAHLSEAEDMLMKYLVFTPQSAAAMYAVGKIRETSSDDDGAIAWFEKAASADPTHVPSWNGLAAAMHRRGRLAEAEAGFARACALDPTWPLLRYNLATVYFDQGSFELAEQAYRETLRLDPSFLDAKLMLSSALDQQNRSAEAEAYMEEYAQANPVALKPCTGPQPIAHVLIILAAGMCNVRTDFFFPTERYGTVTTYIRRKGYADQVPDHRQFPAFDVAFCALADADRADPFLDQAAAFCGDLAHPVLNPPDARIARTRRDLLPALLGDIDGLVIPSTQRIARAELDLMVAGGAAFATAMLVRPCGTHGGKHLTKINDAAALVAYLAEVPSQDHYLTPYCDYRSRDGYYRKYRFIFVDREVYPYHLAILNDWLVHYHRTDMANQPWMRAEEEAFLADYRSVFRGVLGEAVRAVARTLDLDYAGMDCAITPDGRLLVFEANAAMLVHLIDSPEIYPYKHRYVPRIAQAIADLVRKRLAATPAHGQKSPLSD